MANTDKIYLNKNEDVIRIDSEDIGIIEFISGEAFSEKELIGYDLKKNVQPTSNVPLVKLGSLTSATFYINIEKVYENVEYLQNSSVRQRFTGTVTEDRIEGKVRVVKKTVESQNNFAFPVAVEWDPILNEYLESDPLIEADNPQIVAKAKEITKEAMNTWEAAQATARWVWESIEYNNSFCRASALEALKEGKGVCGQFSLLTTALCRAVKIPARSINGYVYNSYKNAFIPHAWVEVYVDETGWRPMDPTWGQFDFVDATHIGFHDEADIINKLNSLKPGVIKVLEYTPEEAGPMPSPPLNMGKLKMKGRELHYEIFDHEKKVGDYTGKINIEPDGNYCLAETLTIPHNNTKSQSKLLMDARGFVLSYVTDGLWDGLKQEREFLFEKDLKIMVVRGEQETQIEIYRPLEDEVQVDLFGFLQWGLFAARLVENVEIETIKTVTVFTVSTIRYSNLEATIRPCIVEFGEYMDVGWFLEISGAQYKKELYITADGILTRIDLPEIQVSAVLVE